MDQQDERTERRFSLNDRVRLNDAVEGKVWGYEWSDGTNVQGQPKLRYHGWFYWFHDLDGRNECCVPENTLARA